MIDLKKFKHMSEYKTFTVYTDGFNPGDKAVWVIGKDMYSGVVMESVHYVGKIDPHTEEEINNIEDYSYDCTAEFIEDDGCHFVAFNRKRLWTVKIVVSYLNENFGKYVEKEYTYYGTKDILEDFVMQFGTEKWMSNKNTICVRRIEYEPYDPHELIIKMPDDYYRHNRHGWVLKDNFYVPEESEFQPVETEVLPF